MNDNNSHATNIDDTTVSSCPCPSISLTSRFIEKPGAINLKKIRDFGVRVANVCAGVQLNPELQKHLNRYLIDAAHTSAYSEADKPLVRGVLISAEPEQPARITSSVRKNNATRSIIVKVMNTSVVKNTTLNKTEVKKYFTSEITKVNKSSSETARKINKNGLVKTESKEQILVDEKTQQALIPKDKSATANESPTVSVRVSEEKSKRIVSAQPPVVNRVSDVSAKNEQKPEVLKEKINSTYDKSTVSISVREDKPERIVSPQHPVVNKIPEVSAGKSTNKEKAVSDLKRGNAGSTRPDVDLKRVLKSSHVDDGRSVEDKDQKGSMLGANSKLTTKSPKLIVGEHIASHLSDESPSLTLKQNPRSGDDSRTMTGNLQSTPTTKIPTIDKGLLGKVTRSINDIKTLTPEKLNSAKYLVGKQGLTNLNNRPATVKNGGRHTDRSSLKKEVIGSVAFKNGTFRSLGDNPFGYRRSSADISKFTVSHVANSPSPELVSRSTMQRNESIKIIDDSNKPIVKKSTNELKKIESEWTASTGPVNQFTGESLGERSIKNKLIYVKTESQKAKPNLMGNAGSIPGSTNQSYRADSSVPTNNGLNTRSAEAVTAAMNNDETEVEQGEINRSGLNHEHDSRLNPEMSEEMVERLFNKFVRTMAIEGERQEFMR